MRKLLDLDIVGDVRGDGYFWAVELVKDKATKETFGPPSARRSSSSSCRGRCSATACTAVPTTAVNRSSRSRRP